MPQATVRLAWYGLSVSEPSGLTAETGVNLDRSDAQFGQEPLPIPVTAPLTVYSALKQIALEVTTGAPTTLSNATARASAAMPNGAGWFYQANTSYVAQISTVGHTTLALIAGQSSLSSDTSYSISDRLQIDIGTPAELRLVVSVAGSGPFTIGLDRGLSNSHASGILLARFTSAGPDDALAEAAAHQPATPSGFIYPTTTSVSFDTLGVSGVSAATTGRKSKFLRLVAGLATAFGINPGTIALPSLIVGYDEQ